MHTLRGKRALITGAGSGIGRAIALRLAGEGADVCLVDIDQEAMNGTARDAAALGVRTLPLRCDVREPAEIAAAVEELLAAWGGVEILVNNAGVSHYGPTDLMTPGQWERVLSINLHAPVHFIRLLLPALLRQPEAHLVNIVSMYGFFAVRKTAAYHATKFALLGLTESLRAEYGPIGIGVTAVCPGFVTTGLFRPGTASCPGDENPHPPRWLCTTPERVAEKTVRAIYRNQRLVLVTPLAFGMYYFKRLAPWLLDWVQNIDRGTRTRKRLRRLAAESQDAAPQCSSQLEALSHPEVKQAPGQQRP
jgi:3-oxoacyl-[acyl-carrier protein] reductase